MTRVHDMGGRFGDGAVVPEPDGPAQFAADWHARALALTLAAGALGRWNIDVSRHARECLSPQDYTRFGYYEKWLAGLAQLLLDRGVVTLDELRDGADGPSDLADRCLKAADVAQALAKGAPSTRAGRDPAFAVGDRVVTRKVARNLYHAGGHTRLPRYAAGIEGQVILRHGAHVLPDASAHDLGDQAEPLYTVAFDAADLWGAAERSGDEVTCDLWESYLAPAEPDT